MASYKHLSESDAIAVADDGGLQIVVVIVVDPSFVHQKKELLLGLVVENCHRRMRHCRYRYREIDAAICVTANPVDCCQTQSLIFGLVLMNRHSPEMPLLLQTMTGREYPLTRIVVVEP